MTTTAAKSSTKKNTLKGLTYGYMEAYIAAHDDENNSIMKEYQDLRANSNDAKEACAEAVSYGEIKEWFLNKYPAIREFHERREKLLENIRGYFLKMAELTGTLWENDSPTASCNHGFASHVVYWMEKLSLLS